MFPAVSATVFTASWGVIVPLVAHVTDTESGTPCEAVDDVGVKAQPVAVPALTKSEPVIPKTFSLKIVVNENGYTVGVGLGMSIVAVGDVLSMDICKNL